jgi:hypothetical protein
MPRTSEFVFSLVAADAVLPPDDVALVKAFSAQFAAIGEPWLLRFPRVSHLTPEQANHRYFENRRDGLNAALIEQMIDTSS